MGWCSRKATKSSFWAKWAGAGMRFSTASAVWPVQASWQASGTHLHHPIGAELVHTQEGQTDALGDASSSHCCGSLGREDE